MLDVDTFLITLYVTADEFCRGYAAELPPERRPGPPAALTRSEVVTLAVLGQWRRFESERAFYRWVARHLSPYFPTLPRRSQFNRLVRRERVTLTRFGLALAHQAAVRTWRDGLYEAIDGTAAPVRQARRRGRGWLVGQADVGWSTHLGWFCGLRVLGAVAPGGAITGYGVASASADERAMADVFLAARHTPTPALPGVGQPLAPLAPLVGSSAADPSPSYYVTDTGYESQVAHRRWAEGYGALVLTPPKRSAAPDSPGSRSKRQWPARWRRWLAGLRQIVETVFARLQHDFRLAQERPHALTGFLARLAAKVALHNFCLWLNVTLARDRMAFATLIDWP